MSTFNLNKSILVATNDDVDYKFRCADSSVRDALITNQQVKVGHRIYREDTGDLEILSEYPTVGSTEGAVWAIYYKSVIEVPSLDKKIYSDYTVSDSEDGKVVTGISSSPLVVTFPADLTEGTRYSFTTTGGDLIFKGVVEFVVPTSATYYPGNRLAKGDIAEAMVLNGMAKISGAFSINDDTVRFANLVDQQGGYTENLTVISEFYDQ